MRGYVPQQTKEEAMIDFQLLANIVEAVGEAIISVDPEGKVTSWNSGATTTYGYTPDERIGQSLEAIVPADLHAEYKRTVNFVLTGSQIDAFETKRHQKDGTIIPVTVSYAPIRDDAGEIVGVVSVSKDITEKKRAEELAGNASEYARSLIEASLDPLVTISPEGKITDVNEATIEATGMDRQQLIGTDFADYFTEPDKAREGYKRVFSEGFVADYPLTIRHQAGQLTDVLYNASVYKDPRGHVLGVFAAARDVTQQKKAGEARSRLAAIVDSTADAIIGKSIEGTITSWNNGAERMFGYSAQEIIGHHVSELIPHHLRDEEHGILARLMTGNRVEPYETQRLRKSSEIFDVSLTVSPVQDADGHIVGGSQIARDITAQKQASQYARSLIEASLDPLVTISPEGKITDVNEATIKVTGVEREDLIGTDFSDYFTSPDEAREGYQQVFSRGFVTDYPLTIRHRDGRLTHVLYNASVYKDGRGNVLGVFAAARDVNAQKLAEAEVAEQRKKELERLGELERFQRLTVGRELKMIELKKQIAELMSKVAER